MKKIIALVLSLVMMSLCCAALAESTYTCTFDLEALAGVTDMNGFVVAMPNSEINTITLKDDGTYVYTLPRTQIVALRLDPCSPDENKTVGLTFTPQSITLNAASTLPGGADYFIPTWYQLVGLSVYPALAAAALDWLWAVGRQLAKKKQ